MFHEKNSYERHHALAKAAETSPFELYHFLQSFFHAAPQIILQLSLVLRDNMFRNYDTSKLKRMKKKEMERNMMKKFEFSAIIQVVSIIFSLIKMAMTLESYQRFESQKVVGRNYPWCSREEVDKRRRQFRRSTSVPVTPSIRDEIKSKLSSFEENFPRTSLNENEEGIQNEEEIKTLNINKNNFDNERKSLKDPYFVSNFTDDDKIKNQEIKSIVHVKIEEPPVLSNNENDEEHMPMLSVKQKSNLTDEDLIESANEGIDAAHVQLRENITPENFDESPTVPPPPKPSSFPYLTTLTRLSTYKNMLIFNTEEFIKEHVPRLPPGLFEHPNDGKINIKRAASVRKSTDDTDISLPTRKNMIQGIEQEDFVAKGVSFVGWSMFILMRMISLSVFSVFFLEACLYLCLAHYLIMLICVFYEGGIGGKWRRKLFYIVLSYIYIFALLEFKIKFKNVRRWYIGYFIFVFLQNLVITIIWMSLCRFESFWFHFLFNTIIQSGILSLCCMVFYFYFLKPKDKVLFVNE